MNARILAAFPGNEKLAENGSSLTVALPAGGQPGRSRVDRPEGVWNYNRNISTIQGRTHCICREARLLKDMAGLHSTRGAQDVGAVHQPCAEPGKRAEGVTAEKG